MELGEYSNTSAWNFAGQDVRDYWLEQADTALRLITEECAKVLDPWCIQQSDNSLTNLMQSQFQLVQARIRQLAGDK